MLIWKTARGPLELTRRAVIMGIVNVTPDSFSDGGAHPTPEAAVAHAAQLIAEGAAIIDVGGESTRPGAEAVSAEEQIRRIVPVVEQLVACSPGTLISVDTSRAAVASAALEAGAAIVNDVTALRGDPEMADVIRCAEAGVVLMHMQGEPRTMQQAPHYEDVVAEVSDFFRERLRFALEAGLEPARLAFDPGIGFGKSVQHNLALCRRLEELAAAVPGRPLALGVSRKSFLSSAIGHDPAVEPPAARDDATVALSVFAREKGVRVLRVHRVRPNVQAVRLVEALLA